MKAIYRRSGESNMFLLLMGILITGLLYAYRTGISGNDFWWHVKAGEWIIEHGQLMGVDAFSWFAGENGIKWVQQEWLSQVLFYLIHHFSGDIGIFWLSVFSALGMVLLITSMNRDKIKSNILLSILYLFPIVRLFPLCFCGRPQLISYYLLFATLYCLYRYKENETSKAVWFVPLISALWSNCHAGSLPLSYLLCFFFLASGLFDFSAGKLKGEKLSKKQLRTYLVVGVLSIGASAINPNGFEILLYPFANMGDSFMQTFIAEWSAPDVKQIPQLIYCFLPVVTVGTVLVMSEKKIRVLDFMLFLFFAYLFLRSVRFSILFFIASTFFSFDYFIPRSVKPIKTKSASAIFLVILLFLAGINASSLFTFLKTERDGKLISTALAPDVIELIQKESPKRLFNDYNYGETLIYHDIGTFIDAREDLFAQHNLQDATSLLLLCRVGSSEETGIFDPEKVIAKYGFDAFVISSDRPLAAYLRSRPLQYEQLFDGGGTAYFKALF